MGWDLILSDLQHVLIAQAGGGYMNWDRILRPDVLAPGLALGIPLVAVLFWGLKSVIQAMNGLPEDFNAWKRELEDLRARVEELEQQNKAAQQEVRY